MPRPHRLLAPIKRQMAATRNKMKARFKAERSKAKRDKIHRAFKKLAKAHRALDFGKLDNFSSIIR